MKKYADFSMLLLFLALLACDEEVIAPTRKLVPDTAAPVVTILSPAPNDSILVIAAIGITAEVTDDRQLENVRIVLATPGQDAQIIGNSFITSIYEYQKFHVGEIYLLPKNAPTGTYTITIEAKDRSQNMSNRTVVVTLHDSDISPATFSTPFYYAFENSRFIIALYEKFGYWSDGLDAWDYGYGYAFSASWLSKVLLLMASRDADYTVSEAEWTRFMADFGLKNQSWAKWDEDKDGSLTEAEFEKGIDGLGFFKAWDKNQDKLVDLIEMSAGVFTQWDQNKNNLLSKEEYLDKFYAYFYR